MDDKNYITFYLCNGEDPNCINSGTCKAQNFSSFCKHTTNVAAAEFGTCDEPWLHPDRFQCIILGNEAEANPKIQYWEKFNPNKLYQYCNGDYADKIYQPIGG